MILEERESESKLLSVRNLHVKFRLNGCYLRAVDGVDLELDGGTLALIGESGSGKSVLGLSILRLLPENSVVSGEVLFKGKNILKMSEKEIRKIRGRDIAWIPQNPLESLNPVLKIGKQVAEPMEYHFRMEKRSVLSKVVKLLKLFDVNPAEKRAKSYPHQMSGGMRQRVLVAMGMSTSPSLIIADEPTKGVDATRKSRVADLFQKISEDVAILLITHDLPFARRVAGKIAVMYCGQIVEIQDAEKFFKSPLHPYSKALISSLPSKGLKPIKGSPPSSISPPSGCRFRPRCEERMDVCVKSPHFHEIDGGYVRCWIYAR